MTPTRPLLAAGLALSLLAAACGGDDGSPDTVVQPGVTTEAAAETSAPSDDGNGDDGGTGGNLESGPATTAGDEGDTDSSVTTEAAPSGDTEALASLEVDTASGNDPVSVRVDVEALDRRGDTVDLELRITNLSDEFEWEIYSSLGGEGGISDVSGLTLVDLAGNKRYLTLVDSEGGCVCTVFDTVIEDVEAGASRTFQASFPAPPADVSSVDVQVPGLGIVTDVPLGDA